MDTGDATDPQSGTHALWTHVDRVALACLVLALAITCVWTVHPWFDKANDASLYLLTARSLASGDGFAYLGEPFVVRPPGWAALLAPFVGSGAPPDFQLLNLVGALFGATASIALFWLARPRLGGPLAALLALAVWLNPSVQRLSTQALSDVPGLTWILVALALERAARERRSFALHVALGVVLTIAVYVRTLAVLLVPAILLGRCLGSRPTGTARVAGPGLAVALILPLVAFAPWIARNANAEVTTPTEQVFLRSYGTAMVHVDAGDPSSERITLADFVARTRKQVVDVLAELGERLPLETPDQPSTWCAWLLLAGALTAWLRRRDATTWMTLATAGVLATYFAFKPRLVLPLWVLTLLLTTEVLHDLAPRKARALARGGLALLLVAVAWLDFDPWSWHDAARKDHEALARVTEKVAAEFEPDAPLASFFGWHLGVFLPNPVYSLSIVASREGPEASLRLLEKHAVEALVFHRKMDPGDMYSNALGSLGFAATQFGNYRVIRTAGFELPGGGQ